MARRTRTRNWLVAIALAVVVLTGFACSGGGSEVTAPTTSTTPTVESGEDVGPGSDVVGIEPEAEPGGLVPDAEPAPPSESGDTGDTGDTGATTGNVVRFVYFVERGETARDDVRLGIERQAIELQAYWYRQFGGTFQLADPIVTVVDGDNDAAWYDTTPDGIHDDPRWYRLGNISTEVRSKLGTVDTRFVTYPATTVAEPRVGVNFGGAWMDGDDALCILGETASFPYPDGNDAHCLGHVAHELGHVFGLGHTGPTQDCMQFGFYDAETMCRFSAENREAVRNDPANVGWLDLELDLPLDPDPEPTPDAGQEPVTGPVDIIVENTGCRSVELLWVEAEDQLRSYGTIAPGASFRQSTFVGHGWTVEVDGEEINRFVVTGPDTIRTDSGGC